MNNTTVRSKSSTAAIFPILIALDKFIEKGIQAFTAITPDQEFLIGHLDEARRIKYSPDEIKSFVSNNVHDLNDKLEKAGFKIRFDETLPFDLGLVTIMDLVGQWQSKATEAEIIYEGEKYPAAKITSGASLKMTERIEEVLFIRATNGLCIFIEKTDLQSSGNELFKHVRMMAKELTRWDSETPCDAVVPFVTLDEQPDISWLTGLQDVSSDLVINQALQQNKLTLNLDGIHAESAVALGGVRSVSFTNNRRQFVVDQPFNIWMTYGDALEFPLFAAHVVPTDWK